MGAWGTGGTGPGQFQGIGGLSADSRDNVYAVDSGNNRVQVFTSTGAFLTQWGSVGSGNGEFRGPTGADLDGAGNIYVIDGANQRVEKFGWLPTPVRTSTWGRVKRLFR